MRRPKGNQQDGDGGSRNWESQFSFHQMSKGGLCGRRQIGWVLEEQESVSRCIFDQKRSGGEGAGTVQQGLRWNLGVRVGLSLSV